MFSDVDADDGTRMVAMMDATDAWPAVRAARSWLLDQSGIGPGAVVVDVGCGPGTFGAEVDGPPGLPLRMIAAAGPCPPGDVDALARGARQERFAATLTMVTALARFDQA